MKVLVYADMRSPHSRGWVDGLQRAGIDVAIVTSHGKPDENDGPLTSSRGTWGRRLRASSKVSDRIRTAEALVRLPSRLLSLRKFAQQVEPDLVHALRLPYEGLTALTAFHRSLPVVVSTWGQDFVRQAANDVVLTRWIHNMLPHADGLISDVPEDLARARQHGFPNGRPQLVAAANFGLQRPSNVARADRPLVVYTRGMRAHVDHAAWLASIPLVIKAASTPPTFIGVGLADCPEAPSVLKDPLVSRHTTLTGNLDQTEYNKIVEQAWITVSPARSDGMPVSVLGSLAQGSATLVGPLPQFHDLARRSPALVVMEGLEPQQIADATLRALATSPSSTESNAAPGLPPEYDASRNREAIPAFYGQILSERC